MPNIKSLAGKRVCIDPGHPSEVGIGTQGKRVTEVGIAWLVALRVRDILTERGAKVLLTKNTERQMVTNRKRAEIANKFEAHLLLRLHCDADAGTGIAVYYPDKQGKTRDGVVGPSSAVIATTAKMAVPFHKALIASLGTDKLKNRGLKTDRETFIGGKQGALTGSIFSTVPTILVEMVVLTNPHDEAFIADPAGREKMAVALADATQAALT